VLSRTCGELVCTDVVKDMWRTGVYWCFQRLVECLCVLMLSKTCGELVCTRVVKDLWRTDVYWCYQGLVENWYVLVIKVLGRTGVY
jgi:hypothetical protein